MVKLSKKRKLKKKAVINIIVEFNNNPSSTQYISLFSEYVENIIRDNATLSIDIQNCPAGYRVNTTIEYFYTKNDKTNYYAKKLANVASWLYYDTENCLYRYHYNINKN